MTWIKVAEFPATKNLADLDRWLKQQHFPHRFTIEDDSQILWTSSAELKQPLLEAIDHFQSTGQSDRVTAEKSASVQLPDVYVPATLILLLLSFAGSAVFSFGEEFTQLFTFYDQTPFYRTRSAFSAILAGEYWRLITPIFLHFGFLHVAFNALWLWYLGSRLELVFGSGLLIALVLILGLTSNIAQALMSYPIPFGGMSGVVFGLLSFFWVKSRTSKDPRLFMPPALFPIMVAFMALSVFGVFDWMTGANAEVADTAHISGFFCGLLLAGLHYLIGRPTHGA